MNPWLIVEMEAVLSVYRCFLGQCWTELAGFVAYLYSREKSFLTRYFDSLHDFPINIPRCYKDSYPNNYFPRCAGLFGILCL